MKRGLIVIFIGLFLISGVSADFTVCPDGDNSCDYTQSQFENLGGPGYAGHTFFFKNTETFTELDINIRGTSDSNRVTLDGLQSGNYDAYSEATGNVARIRHTGTGPAIDTHGVDYITIQDFEVDCDDDAVVAQTYILDPRDGSSYMTIRRIFAHDAQDGIQTLNGDYVTIGGAPGDGVVIKDAGVDSGSEDIAFSHITHGVISYNHLYATRDYTNSNARGIDGIVLLWSDHIMIEHNEIHSHNDHYGSDAMGEDGIDIKENNEYIIVRHNNIYDHNCDNNNGCGSQHGILLHSGHANANGYQHHIYIYGNYIHDNEDTGIMIWARGDTSGSYNDDLHDIYVWSNIIEDNAYNGVSLHETDLNADLYNVYIYNNVFEGNSHTTIYTEDTAFRISNCQNNILFKNNILYNNEAASNRRQYHISNGRTSCISSMSYNDIFHPTDGSNTRGYFGTSGLITASQLNSQSNANNNVAVNPLFTNPSSHDFSLQSSSPMKNSGERITQSIGTVTIQGKQYDLSFRTALHPSTDWDNVVYGTVYPSERPTSGNWDLGAYYGSGSITPLCSQGQITQTCLCGGVEYSSGFCCSNNWQSSECPLPPPPISQDGWTLHYIDSEEIIREDNSGENAFDGNPSTYWHTEWDGDPDPAHPHEIQINLNANYILSSLSYLPRQDDENGRIASYEFYVSSDGNNWGSSVASGSFVNSASAQEITFSDVNARYIRLVAISEVNGGPWTSVAEINLFGELSSSTSQCSSGADTTVPADDIVSIQELISYISSWKSGVVSINELINAIGEWKNGCS